MAVELSRRLLRLWESPPTWLALFLLAAHLQTRYLPLADPGPVLRSTGAAMIVAALGLMLAAVLQFRRHRTTVLPRETPGALIDAGPFRFSRNPIYLADAMILAGAALRWDLGALILVPLFMGVIQTRFIRGEEAGLRAAFGDDFDAYSARTRRWL